jgi:nicotinamidase/pyrazinamidase
MRTVFVDVDTQVDFLYPAGALHVPGSEHLQPVIARLNHYAAAHSIPLISTADTHSENDPEFRIWPPHCVVDTAGHAKPAETLLDDRVRLSTKPGETIQTAAQIIVEKHTNDVFSNPNFHRLLEGLKADRYVVYGVATDYCVRCAAMGLLAAGQRVTLLTDAIAAVNPEDGRRVIAEFTAQGGLLDTVAGVTP